ncbi:hypothetical protein P7C70_g4499, partial [Phenoliferia sp. Uapishka_3]
MSTLPSLPTPISYIPTPSTLSPSSPTQLSPPSDGTRPTLQTRPSEVNRQLESAMAEELDPPSPVQLQRPEPGPRKAHRPPPSLNEDHGLLHQFRNGTGWFAPVVPSLPPPTREEREFQEAARIKSIREGAKEKRPTLMKRLSSGVELMGISWGAKGDEEERRMREAEAQQGLGRD